MEEFFRLLIYSTVETKDGEKLSVIVEEAKCLGLLLGALTINFTVKPHIPSPSPFEWLVRTANAKVSHHHA